MRAFLPLIAVFGFALSGALGAQGLKSFSTDYETAWSPPDDRFDAEATAWFSGGMQFDGNFRIWFLLGEPVVNCTARWVSSSSRTMSIRVGDDTSLETAQDGEVEVYNLLLAASWPDPRDTQYGNGSAKSIAAICDAGIVAQNGRNGFNVAGSPSWDEFLCALPDAAVRLKHTDDDICKAMGGQWLDAASAKEVAVKGLIIANSGGRMLGPDERAHDDVSVTVLTGEVSGMGIAKRVEKGLWREKSASYKLERTAAYFTRFASRPGEGSADTASRKVAAMNSLPTLPREDPSTAELKAYEEAWQAMLGQTGGADAAFEKEWREKEKTLVGETLARVKVIDKAASQEEEAFARYDAELQKLKENEPKSLDPMAAYRTTTPLIEYEDKIGRRNRCGFKKQDGSIVIRAELIDCLRAPDGYGLYTGMVSRNDDTAYYSGCSDHACGLVLDQEGRTLVRFDVSNMTASFSEAYLKYGLIYFIGSRYGGARLYSIPEQRYLFDTLPDGYNGTETYGPLGPYLRRDRIAVSYRHYGSPCDDYHSSFAYFYLDTKRFEEIDVCANSARPLDDPLNTEPD